MTGRGLYLLVPGLFGPMPAGALTGMGGRWPQLERLLGRADRSRRDWPGVERRAAELLQVELSSEHDVPAGALAAVRYLPQNQADQGCWLKADPVHLHADRDSVLLVPGRHLQLDQPAASEIEQAINAFLSAEADYAGWRFFAPDPLHWLLRIPEPLNLKTRPLADVAARDMRAFLPRGGDAMRLHGLMNELQMLLHALPLNQRREDAGQPIINGIWLHGQGSRADVRPGAASDVTLFTDDPVLAGLALVSGGRVGASSEFTTPTSAVVHESRVWQGIEDQDLDTWLDGIDQLESRLVQCQQALADGQLDWLQLEVDDGAVFRWRHGHRLRFWRPGVPLMQRLQSRQNAN